MRGRTGFSAGERYQVDSEANTEETVEAQRRLVSEVGAATHRQWQTRPNSCDTGGNRAKQSKRAAHR